MTAAQPGAAGAQAVELSQVSLPRLLFSLLHQRFTGTVTLDQVVPHSGSRTVWFRGGMAVFTDWSEPTEVLGQVLIAQRVITEEHLLGALEMMARQGGLLGQTLMAMGRINAQQLAGGLRRQCARKLVAMVALQQGRATITPGEHGVGLNDGLLAVNVLEVLHSAVSTHYDQTRAASEMSLALQGGLTATPSLSKYVSHFRFRATDRAGLQALLRGTQYAVMSTLEGMTTRRAAQLVYLLWACQMLRVTAAPTPMVEPTRTGDTAPPPGFTPTAYQPQDAVPSPSAATPEGFMPTAHAPAPTPAAVQPPAPPRPATPARAAPAPKPAAPKPVAPKPIPPKPTEPKSAKPSTEGLDGVDPEFAQELLALEEKIASEAHPFDLFGLPTEATRKDVRRAWGDLSRKFHPDVLASAGLEHLRDRVGEAFAALSEAHQLLADAEQRAQLADQIQAGDYGTTSTDATATARAAFEAELIMRDGEKLLRSNNYARALERFEAAAAVHTDPSTEASIAWCAFQVSNKSQRDATLANTKLQQIVEEFPNIPPPHYYRGFVLMQLGQDQIAINEFTEAYKLDPRLIDAERQARALRMKRKSKREEAAQPRKGLRGLFGKK